MLEWRAQGTGDRDKCLQCQECQRELGAEVSGQVQDILWEERNRVPHEDRINL